MTDGRHVRSDITRRSRDASKFGEASGKFAKHVIRRRNAFGRSVADERIRAETPGTQNVSRNREHLFSEIEGELRRNEASRFFRRLGYERTVGKTRHQSVADGKMVRHRSNAGGESGDDGPARFHYRIEKRAVRSGIVDVDTGSDERDGNAAGFHRREMGGRIDSRRSSGNGRDAARTEGRNEPFGHFLAVGRGFSRSDDRNGDLGPWQRSPNVEQKRPSRHRQEGLRVFAVAFENDSRPYLGSVRKGVYGRFEVAGVENGGYSVGRDSRDRQRVTNDVAMDEKRFGIMIGIGRVRKEAEFAMGGSGRVQPNQDFITHADRKGVG